MDETRKPSDEKFESSPQHETPIGVKLPEDRERRRWRRILTNIFLSLLLAIGAAAVAWQFYGEHLQKSDWLQQLLGKEQESAAAESDVYYCPMHKEYESDKPGNCPICSMKLVKKPASTREAGTSSETRMDPAMPGMNMDKTDQAGPMASGENTIFIPPQQQQLIGVRTEPATFRSLAKEIRTVGKVAYDETSISHVHTKVSGWIEHVFVDFVGQFVKKGDPLFTIYSPDLVATQEEYLLALRTEKDLINSSFEEISKGARSLVEASRRRLQLWDVSDEEIARLEREGKARREMTIYSPVSGLVTERAAYHHGRHVTPEMDLYTLVDLSRVWVLGEIYEYDLPFVQVGQKAVVEVPSERIALAGTVKYLYPYLNPNTRSSQIRMEFQNPQHRLKPDMFVNLVLKVELGRQLTVPEDAVLDTGTQQYVFLDQGNGYFEPRLVKVGPQAQGRYVILEGLKSGESVVTAANFILDSESRLKGAFANMGAPKKVAPSGAAAAQQLRIQLRTQPDPAKVGNNNVQVNVADDKGKPISDADVRVKIFMPAMGSMPPMSAEARLSARGNGQYSGVLNIPMAWTWQTTVTVERGGKVLGTAQVNLTAR